MKIVFSHTNPKDALVCQSCGKKITDIVNDVPVIPYKDLYRNGNIPVLNLGWFCSQ